MKIINMRDSGIPENAVRIDRRTQWGNPYRIGRDGTREEVIELYRVELWRRIRSGKITLKELAVLDGKTLACWCAPHRCHGEVLSRAATWAARQLAGEEPMKIEWVGTGEDMLRREHRVVVSPVNAVGVSGKGLAAQIKRRFPREEKKYVEACRSGMLQAGGAILVDRLDRPGRWVAFVATKAHWRNPSRISWIQSGVAALARTLATMENKVPHPIDVALPRLGCGLGGLEWNETAPVIETEIKRSGTRLEWFIYGPRPQPMR